MFKFLLELKILGFVEAPVGVFSIFIGILWFKGKVIEFKIWKLEFKASCKENEFKIPWNDWMIQIIYKEASWFFSSIAGLK